MLAFIAVDISTQGAQQLVSFCGGALQWGLAIILTTIDILVLFTWLPVNLQIKQWSSVSGALLPIGQL